MPRAAASYIFRCQNLHRHEYFLNLIKMKKILWRSLLDKDKEQLHLLTTIRDSVVNNAMILLTHSDRHTVAIVVTILWQCFCDNFTFSQVNDMLQPALVKN